ncbi:unnamed protein product [Leptidea sinapis]|uniref:Uncharacterized protein n=1 Tax=Leptidea sinapis TaxID=189913 RepID=A0A5E4Q2S2_9NEOP|nr:unnamed protein product [Leptidea sinapis]
MLKILNNQEKCIKVCASEDILSEEANFYCKYYKWGLEILHNTTSNKQPSSESVVVLPANSTQTNDKKPESPVVTNQIASGQASDDAEPKQIVSSVQSTKLPPSSTVEVSQGTKLVIPLVQESSSSQKQESTANDKEEVKPVQSESEVEKPFKEQSPDPAIDKSIEQQTLLKPILVNPNILKMTPWIKIT